MNINQLFVIMFVGFFCVAGATGFLLVRNSDYSNQVNKLDYQLITELDSHNITKANLSWTRNQLNSTTLALSGVITEKSNLITEKNTLINNLQIANAGWELTKNDLVSVRNELNWSRNGTKYSLHDPTYNETLSFLMNDITNNHTWNATMYNCVSFSVDVKNNATKLGIRCAMVFLYYYNTSNASHAMVGFNTSDQGFIYIEPQNDIRQNITINGTYITNVVRDILIVW